MSLATYQHGLRGALRRSWAVTLRHVKVWRANLVVTLVGALGEPTFYLLAMGIGVAGYIDREVDGLEYMEFIGPALAVTSAMFVATFVCTIGAFARLDNQRTYDAIVATPVSVAELVGGEVIYAGLRATFSSLLVLVVLLGFGLVRSPTALLVLPVAFATGWVFASLGLLLVAHLPPGGWDYFTYYFTLFISPMFFFGGVFFPLDDLPPYLAVPAEILPLTHAVRVGRGLVLGTSEPWHLASAAALLAMGAVSYALAVRAMRRRLVV